jgi:uncharacterized membrane protein
MYSYNFYGLAAMSGIVVAFIFGIVLSVLLGRLILVATQALRAYTLAKNLQMDLLLEDTDDEDPKN